MSNSSRVDANVGLIQGSVFVAAGAIALYRTSRLVKSCFDRSKEAASAYQTPMVKSKNASSDNAPEESRKSVPFAISTNRNSLLSQDSELSGDSTKTIVDYKLVFRIFLHLLFTPKVFFHMFVLAYLAFQIANGFIIYRDASSTTYAYICYVVGMYCYLVAIMMISLLWSSAVLWPKQRLRIRKLMLFLVSLNTCYMVTVVCVAASEPDFRSYREEYPELVLSREFVETGCLIFATIGMGLYSYKLQKRMSDGSINQYVGDVISRVEDPNLRAGRIAALRRIRVTLFICSLCYFVRVIGLMRAAYRHAVLIVPNQNMEQYVYYPLFIWLPYLVSGLVLLVVTKSTATKDLSQLQLQSTYGPSAERSTDAALNSSGSGRNGSHGGSFSTGPQSIASSDRSVSFAQRWRSDYSKKVFEAFVNSSLRNSLNVPVVFDDANNGDAAHRESDTPSVFSSVGDNNRPGSGRTRSQISSEADMGKLLGFDDDPARRFLNVSVDKPDFEKMRMDNFSQDSGPPPPFGDDSSSSSSNSNYSSTHRALFGGNSIIR